MYPDFCRCCRGQEEELSFLFFREVLNIPHIDYQEQFDP